MKVIPKPLQTRTPALKAIVSVHVPSQRAYEQLVTSQNVAPDRAKVLLQKE